MSADTQTVPAAPRAQVSDDEKGVVIYTPAGGTAQIKLTLAIIRKFFCPEADDLGGMAFAGFCRSTGLDPFKRECFLEVFYSNRYKRHVPSIITAYQVFMKRGERHPQYSKFKAGIILEKDQPTAPDFAGEPGLVPLIQVIDEQGKPAPCPIGTMVAIEGMVHPRGYIVRGGWCKVWRKDRGDEPFISTIPIEEYVGRKQDGTVTAMWSEKERTMLRKTAIGQCFRDAFPDELHGLYLQEELTMNPELATRTLPTTALTPPVEGEGDERPPVDPLVQAELDKLTWTGGQKQMWLANARLKDKSVEVQVAELKQAQASGAPGDVITVTPETGPKALGPAVTALGGALIEDGAQQLDLVSRG